ncbi:ribulose-phosphate 3-epimerase [Clostridium sp. CAG:571]|nr:ribulose-phosphate 3-epimerase [Clostridium sp. CAG:571]
MVEVSTSILQVKKDEIITKIYDLETAHTDFFHIDVMDGDFVKNDTTNIMREFCEYIKQITSIQLDIHLMVEDVKSYITSYLSFNPNIITFHLEACKDKNEVMDLIKYVKENNCKVGIAIKPNTSVEEIYEYLPYIHMCLIMTVEPGKGGQKLIPSTIEKIKKLNTYIVANNLELDIEADGGINVENVKKVAEAGTDIIVSGSAILNSENYKEYIKNLKNC